MYLEIEDELADDDEPEADAFARDFLIPPGKTDAATAVCALRSLSVSSPRKSGITPVLWWGACKKKADCPGTTSMG